MDGRILDEERERREGERRRERKCGTACQGLNRGPIAEAKTTTAPPTTHVHLMNYEITNA